MKRRLKSTIKRIPFLSDAARSIYNRLNKKSIKFDTSEQYWNERYSKSGDSGDGSYGRLAEFKAEVINNFINEHEVKSVVEFGCGDGAQLKKIRCLEYVGVDVSPVIIKNCTALFNGDSTKEFFHASDPRVSKIEADLALSLDVIYHLVEDEVFDLYMRRLMNSSNQWVIIYSSNFEQLTNLPHVRHRNFSAWIEDEAISWCLHKKIDQKYPYKSGQEDITSLADFFIYRRIP